MPKYFYIIALFVVLLCSCKKQVVNDELDTPFDDVPISEIDDAPADQIKALTEDVEPDSADLSWERRNSRTYIYVSKPKMRLYVVDANDSVLFSCGIACGLRKGNKEAEEDYKTPEGHFRISGIFESTEWIHKTKDDREVLGCYGPYFLRLKTGKFHGIGIHGTNAPRSIGRRASEGCIRVNSTNIELLHDVYAYNGMPVVVSSEREPLPPFKGLDVKHSAAAVRAKLHADSLALFADTLSHTKKENTNDAAFQSKNADIDSRSHFSESNFDHSQQNNNKSNNTASGDESLFE